MSSLTDTPVHLHYFVSRWVVTLTVQVRTFYSEYFTMIKYNSDSIATMTPWSHVSRPFAFIIRPQIFVGVNVCP